MKRNRAENEKKPPDREKRPPVNEKKPPVKENKPPRVKKKPLPRRKGPELKDGSLKVIILLAAVLVLIFAGFVALNVVSYIKGGVILVGGESPYTDEEIVRASGINTRLPLFADTGKAERLLLESKPYLREVNVEKLLCFVVITVKADKPAYYIINDGESFILAEDMRVIDCIASAEEARSTGAVRLELPDLSVLKVGFTVEYDAEGKNTYVAEMLELIMSKDYAPYVTEIGLAGKYDDVYITFYGKCRIFLGSISDFDEKMRIAETILEDNRDSIYSCAVINVSVPDRPTFRPVDSLD